MKKKQADDPRLRVNFTGYRYDPAARRPADGKLWLAPGKKTFMLLLLNDLLAASTGPGINKWNKPAYA